MKDESERLNNLINSSGFPFQLAVEQEIMRTIQTHRWEICSREHPWENKEDSSRGFVDLIVGSGRVRIIIECKRPRGGIWIFPIYEGRQERVCEYRACWGHRLPMKNDLVGWGNFELPPSSYESDFCIIHGQNEKSKPMLERIAGYLISSSESIALEELRLDVKKELDTLIIVIPIVVTSAKLKICRLKPDQISLGEGIVDNPSFEDVPFIRFRKSLATKEMPWSVIHDLKDVAKEKERSIFVVNSLHLPRFLEQCDINNFRHHRNHWEFARARISNK